MAYIDEVIEKTGTISNTFKNFGFISQAKLYAKFYHKIGDPKAQVLADIIRSKHDKDFSLESGICPEKINKKKEQEI